MNSNLRHRQIEGAQLATRRRCGMSSPWRHNVEELPRPGRSRNPPPSHIIRQADEIGPMTLLALMGERPAVDDGQHLPSSAPGEQGTSTGCDRAFDLRSPAMTGVVIGEARQDLRSCPIPRRTLTGIGSPWSRSTGRCRTPSRGNAVRRSPSRHVSERPVVHVDHAPPGDLAGVDVERIAVENGVAHEADRRLCAFHRREVVGEVEVDVVHGQDARQTAAGRPPLMPNTAQRRLPERRDRGLLPGQGLRSPIDTTSCPRPPGGRHSRNEDQVGIVPARKRRIASRRTFALWRP